MYILKYSKSIPQSIAVEAWPRLKEYATFEEKNRPSFTIGSVAGSRTIMLWHYVEELQRKYEHKYHKVKSRCYEKILYPPEDPIAVNDAYRLGLAAAVIEAADNSSSATSALTYVMNTTKEEVWFWSSKLLGVIGYKTDRIKVLTSLFVLSGAKNLEE